MKCPACSHERKWTDRTIQATDTTTVRKHRCARCHFEWESTDRIDNASLEKAAAVRKERAAKAAGPREGRHASQAA